MSCLCGRLGNSLHRRAAIEGMLADDLRESAVSHGGLDNFFETFGEPGVDSHLLNVL